jgi:hypothetical protein
LWTPIPKIIGEAKIIREDPVLTREYVTYVTGATPGTCETRKKQANGTRVGSRERYGAPGSPLTPECNHMGILEHSFLAESRGMVASCDN